MRRARIVAACAMTSSATMTSMRGVTCSRPSVHSRSKKLRDCTPADMRVYPALWSIGIFSDLDELVCAVVCQCPGSYNYGRDAETEHLVKRAVFGLALLCMPALAAAQPGFPPDNPDSWRV